MNTVTELPVSERRPRSLKVSIFEFTDYRTFLEKAFQEIKTRNPRFTYNSWAVSLGLKNSSSLLKILHGSRDAGPQISEKLIRFFGFSTRERLYFEDLIRLSKVKDNPELRVLLLERLSRSHPRKDFQWLNQQEFSAIAKWWYYGLRQLTRAHRPLKNDAQSIASLFLYSVTPTQVSKAVKDLLELRLLKKEKGVLHASQQSLNTSDDIVSEACKQFHEQILDLGKQAIRKTRVEEREISGLTVAIRSEDLPRVKEYIRKTQEEFCKLFEQADDGDVVYQYENLLFPLSKKHNQGEQS